MGRNFEIGASQYSKSETDIVAREGDAFHFTKVKIEIVEQIQ